MTEKALSLLIHGHTKVGKTTAAITAPYPRLLLDVEAASRFLPINRKIWDPFTEEMPVADGSWDTVVVYTRDYKTMVQVYNRLNTENHQFKSLIIDSVSELQVRLQEQIAGRGQMQMQQWGEMLRIFSGLMRDMRDLTMHPVNPIEAVVLTAMTFEKDGIYKPYLQGQLATQAPYLFDVIGYLYVDQVQPEDPSQPAVETRKLLTRKHPQFEAGERVQGKLAHTIENPNIEEMINTVFDTLDTTPTVNNDNKEVE